MFEDERQRVSHRRGAIARGVAKRGLVAFLAFAMAFGTTPSQLWAEGADGIAEAVAQATTPGEGTGAADGTADQGKAEVSDSGSAPAASAATTEAATGDEGSATGESPATSERSSTASAGQAGSAAAAAVQTENPTETGDVVKKQIEVSFSIIGTDADGKAQTWVAPTQLKLDEGATAADAFIKLQEKTGFKAKYDPNTAYGFYLESITSPSDGRTLAYDPATHAYWQLFINGKSSDYTADNVTIHAGDTVTWFYGGWGDQLPSDSVHASVQVLGKDKDGKQQVWASTGQTSLKAGSTAKDLLEQTGLKLDAGESSWGWFLNGIYSPFDVDGKPYVWDAATNSYWRFYVNGKFADVGAGAYKLQEGDAVTFMYAGDSDALPGQVLGSADVIGPDVNGNNTRWGTASNVSLPEGSTAQDLIEAVLKAKGVTYNGSQSGGTGSSIPSTRRSKTRRTAMMVRPINIGTCISMESPPYSAPIRLRSRAAIRLRLPIPPTIRPCPIPTRLSWTRARRLLIGMPSGPATATAATVRP